MDLKANSSHDSLTLELKVLPMPRYRNFEFLQAGTYLDRTWQSGFYIRYCNRFY